MPHVTIYMYPGHTEQDKKQVCSRMKEVLMEELHVKEGAVSVGIREIEEREWKQKVYDEQIYAKETKLYLEPGYQMDF